MSKPALPLAALAAQMRDERERLDARAAGGTTASPRTVPSRSRTGLSERGARMLRLLGVHPGPDVTVEAAASLAGLPRDEARLALGELHDEHLFASHAAGRYVINDLLRVNAAEIAGIEDGAAERRAAMHCLLDHYLHTARTASGLLSPKAMRPELSRPLPGVQAEEIGDSSQAQQWVNEERRVLLAAIDLAVYEGCTPHAWALPWVVGSFLRDRACRRRLAAAQMTARCVAAQHGDLAGEALASLHLGQLSFWLGEHADSCRYLEDAIEMYRAQGDQAGVACALSTLGWQISQLGVLP